MAICETCVLFVTFTRVPFLTKSEYNKINVFTGLLQNDNAWQDHFGSTFQYHPFFTILVYAS